MELDGKVALVTGGGTGIGRATALALAERGCSVVANYSRSVEAAQTTAELVADRGARGLALQGDVAVDGDCRRMIDETVTAFGQLDVLVNSAGTTVFVEHGDLDGTSFEDWQRLYAVNTIGPFQMMRAAADHLRAGDGGEVVNVSSVSGVAGLGSSLPYCASKAALNNLTVTMARVLAPEVRVNAVAPGFVTGRWWTEGQGQDTHDRVKDALERSTPLQRVCAPDDVAKLIVALVDGADLTTGQVVVIDGGMLIGR